MYECICCLDTFVRWRFTHTSIEKIKGLYIYTLKYEIWVPSCYNRKQISCTGIGQVLNANVRHTPV